MFIGRTFNNYYLLWPLTGAAVAALHRGRRARNANCCARPVTYTRSSSATTGLAYLPPGKRQTCRPFDARTA